MHRKLFPPHRQCLPRGCYCQLTACKVAPPTPTVSLRVAVSLSFSPPLCVNGVRISGNFVAQDKSQAAASPGIRHPPYHPDDPECQLPFPALQGVACHSGCGSCVSGIEEALTVCPWRSETLQYTVVLLAAGQPQDNQYQTTSLLQGRQSRIL